MSWQAYVDDHLMCDIDGHHLTAAAILGHDGSVWAQSSTFPKVLSHSSTYSLSDYSSLSFYYLICALFVPSENEVIGLQMRDL